LEVIRILVVLNIDWMNLLCGIGNSKIFDNKIVIKKYPFKPSKAYPENEFLNSEIECICLEASPLFFKTKDDLIFITTEQKNELTNFAEKNKITLIKQTWNWDRILEPFLDTEFDDKDKKKTLELLLDNGISEKEVLEIRAEVKNQMYKYNFDTMLWEWGSLGLMDVLSAMRVKYHKNKFNEFYYRAIEIELREK